MRCILPVLCIHMRNKKVWLKDGCACFDPSSHSRSDCPRLSPCRPCNSLLLCSCWKVKGGSCCDMKGLRVSAPPLWSIYTQHCNWWHCGEAWGDGSHVPDIPAVARDDCFTSSCQALQSQGVCGASAHVHTKIKTNSEIWKHRIWKPILRFWPGSAGSLKSLFYTHSVVWHKKQNRCDVLNSCM